eukprot:1148385-Pelagomonas_calceolata.AAC.2
MVPRQGVLWETWRYRKEKFCSKGILNLRKVWKVHQIGEEDSDVFGLASSRASQAVEGVAAWASARDTGISQAVIFKANLVFNKEKKRKNYASQKAAFIT